MDDKIRIAVKRMVIADPCYIDADDLRVGRANLAEHLAQTGQLLDGTRGTWDVEITTGSEGRVSILRATRVTPDFGFLTSLWEQLPTECGVDSGQMFLGDERAFGLDYDELLATYTPNDRGGYDENLIPFAGGAVSSTGYGDGGYPVYVRRDLKGRVRVLAESGRWCPVYDCLARGRTDTAITGTG
jgi:hypothetical protein